MRTLLIISMLFLVGCGAGRAVDGAGRAVDGIRIYHPNGTTTWCSGNTCYHPNGTTTYIPASPLSTGYNYRHVPEFDFNETWDSNRRAYDGSR